jgi:hypothetical protein
MRTVENAVILHSVNRGSTVSLIYGNLAGQNCYAVSTYPELTVALPSEPSAAHLFAFVLNNLVLLLHPERALGTWVDNGVHVLDVVTCVSDREIALELGSRFGQCSVFNLGENHEILVRPDRPTKDEASERQVKS